MGLYREGAHIINNNATDKFVKIEICCGSAEDVHIAAAAGANRVELNSALELGGLTPSIGALRLASKSGIEIIAMLRPRGGNFCYSESEFETMLLDLKLLLDNGADGIAFGILKKDRTLDVERCRIMLAAMDKNGGNHQAVFHMAFDESATDEFEMLSLLDGLGFTRLLTRGRADSAFEGISTLKAYVKHIKQKGLKLEILPGGGVRTHNAPKIIEATGANQLHGKFHKDLGDGVLLADYEGLKVYTKWAKNAIDI